MLAKESSLIFGFDFERAMNKVGLLVAEGDDFLCCNGCPAVVKRFGWSAVALAVM